MAVKMRVTYLDGRKVEVLASPRAQFMTEERFAGINDGNRIRASYFLAWASLHKSGQEAAEFEQFLDNIEDIEDVADGITADDVDPTPAEVPPVTSVTSP